MTSHREELRYEKNADKNWRMKGLRLNPCDDLDGCSDEMAEEIELRKRKDENTWN